MVSDIGYLLFKDILGMIEYPSSPFTGLIVNDLVMFFLIPTIFIILVVYMLLARLVPIDNKGMRLMVGLGVYLFIIFGGYYSVFARLAGPYFIFIIFILGLLYFFLGHFRAGGGGGPHRAPGGGGFSRAGGDRDFAQMDWFQLNELKARLRDELTSYNKQIREAATEARKDELRSKAASIESELKVVESQLNWAKKYGRKFGMAA